MSMKRSFWGLLSPSDPLPATTKRPYRDAALVHGALAAAIVGFGWATGAGVGRAAAMAAGYFVLATGWTWWRLRRRQLHDPSIQGDV